MFMIDNYERKTETYDSFYPENDVAEYTHTIIDCSVGGHELHFEKQGNIKNPTRWVIDNALKEVIHNCGHQELLKHTNEKEEDYHMYLCEDDFYDEEIVAQGGVDIRQELCTYDEMSYNSDIFFIYYNFLKGKLTSDEILEAYIELLDVKDCITPQEWDKYTEEYDKHIELTRENISLVGYILREATKEE